MPPKTKTPLKEAAMASQQLDQMLAMLQAMSAQIAGLSQRMDAAEKESDAARGAVNAIKKVGKKKFPRKATDRARENQKEACRRAKLKGSKCPAKTSRDEEADVEIISSSKNVVTKIGAHVVKTVLTIMGSKKKQHEEGRTGRLC